MHNESPTYLTSAEVCDRLGIDRSTLSRWVASGRIKYAIKLPGLRGAYVFTPEAVDAAALKAAS